MYLDLFICVLLLWAVFNGWRNGFLKEVFSILGVIVGLMIAISLYFYVASDYFKISGSETNQFLNIVAFFILWIVLPLGLGLIANVLTTAVKGMMLGIPNSLLGALLSVAKFAILISCILNMMGSLHILDKKVIRNSRLYEPAINIMPFVKEQAQDLCDEADWDKAEETTRWVYRH